MARVMTQERANKIRQAWKDYKACSKERLRELVIASQRIIDTSEMDKQSMISHLVCREYGQADVEAAFAKQFDPKRKAKA